MEVVVGHTMAIASKHDQAVKHHDSGVTVARHRFSIESQLRLGFMVKGLVRHSVLELCLCARHQAARILERDHLLALNVRDVA